MSHYTLCLISYPPFKNADIFHLAPHHTPKNLDFPFFSEQRLSESRRPSSCQVLPVRAVPAALFNWTVLFSLALMWQLFSLCRLCLILDLTEGIIHQNNNTEAEIKLCYFHAIANMYRTDLLKPWVSPCKKLEILLVNKQLWCLFLLPSRLLSCTSKVCLLISNVRLIIHRDF